MVQELLSDGDSFARGGGVCLTTLDRRRVLTGWNHIMMRILFDFRAVHFSRCLLSFKIEILNGLPMALNAPMVTDYGRLGWRDIRDVGWSDLLFTLFLEGENKFL